MSSTNHIISPTFRTTNYTCPKNVKCKIKRKRRRKTKRYFMYIIRGFWK